MRRSVPFFHSIPPPLPRLLSLTCIHSLTHTHLRTRALTLPRPNSDTRLQKLLLQTNKSPSFLRSVSHTHTHIYINRKTDAHSILIRALSLSLSCLASPHMNISHSLSTANGSTTMARLCASLFNSPLLPFHYFSLFFLFAGGSTRIHTHTHTHTH